MSIRSSRSSHVSLARNSLSHRKSLSYLRVRIADDTVKNVLKQLLEENNSKPYEDLVCALRDCAIPEDDLNVILVNCSSCVGMLGREAKFLVEVLLSLNWPSMPKNVVDAYVEWVINLLTAQIYHTPLAMKSIMKLLGKCDALWNDEPSKEQLIIFSNVHNLIAQIVEAIPMSTDVLLHCAVENYPYYKQSTSINQAYVHNLLWITRYLPSLSDSILTLIFNRLIVMDLSLRNRGTNDDDIFTMDSDVEENVTELTECLDLCMKEVFYWIDLKGPAVLELLIPVYQRVILPTHGTNNIQFIMLYGLSIDVTKVQYFLELMWKSILSAQIGPGLRQAYVSHLTGILARANYIPLEYVKLYINKMAEWCNFYIKTHEGINSNSGKNPHNVFYSVCQSIFYLIAFKQKTIFHSKKGIAFVESLNLPKIIMSSLNPLRACNMGIAEAFASVTRIHQIVYCHTIMEQNTRHYLRLAQNNVDQDWFPFDPFMLPKSFKWIEPIYGEYEENIKEISNKNMDICEEDDFLACSPSFSFMSKSLNSLRHAN